MEKWTIEDVIDLLKQDYCFKWRRKEHFERNDDDVDREYEIAQMEYIVDLLEKISGKKKDDIWTELDELLEGVFLFDPQDNEQNFLVEKGCSYYSAQDIYYSDLDSFMSMYDKEDLDFMFEEIFEVNDYLKEVYIPKGTKMTYKGCEHDASGWPTFEIHGEEFDFAGDAFKLKPVK